VPSRGTCSYGSLTAESQRLAHPVVVGSLFSKDA
jgi:hypothetical protein